MPFSYEGTLKEHDLVRSEAGFFDVSHMGRIHIDINEINKVSDEATLFINNNYKVKFISGEIKIIKSHK